MRATDRALSTRTGVIRLLHDAHNDVNIRTGKRKMSLQRHMDLYDLKREPLPLLESAVGAGVALIVYAIATRLLAHRRASSD